jgi:hypothetical protein
MSHDRSWRAACLISIKIPCLHFGIHFQSTRRDSCGRWLWRLVRPVFLLPGDHRGDEMRSRSRSPLASSFSRNQASHHNFFFWERSHRRGASMNASRLFLGGRLDSRKNPRRPRVFSFEAFASRLYVKIPWTLYACSSNCRTNIRTRALPCLTSKMSHARSWHDACLITITNPLLHFDHHFDSTRRDSCGRWLWRLVGLSGFTYSAEEKRPAAPSGRVSP